MKRRAFETPLTGQPPPLFPRWEPGTKIAGKRLLVWPEQGLGDAIMALRYVKLAADAGAEVLLACRAPLAPLFEGQVPATVLSLAQNIDVSGVELACTDFDIMRGHWAFGEPTPPPLPLAGTPAASGGIGIVWRGNPKHPNDAHRSLPRAGAEALLAMSGAVSLLPEDTGAADFQQTADIIAGLDRVISVDTSIAHLAASMGKPVTLLLPAHDLDWRWEKAGSRTRWYPSVEIMRQSAPGWWGQVVEAIAADQGRMKTTSASPSPPTVLTVD